MDGSGECDVLIVGAGPVGLFLAHECTRRGLRWRLIEARASQSAHSKALAVFPRTLEVFDMAGIVQPFLDAANRVTWISLRSRSRALARVRFAPEGTPYPFVAMVPQDVTERILVQALQQSGGRVEYDTSFVSAVERDGAMHVTLDRRGETALATAAYVVGCDGAHSAVRHGLDLPFAGREYRATFMLADAETNDALPADEMQLCPHASGPLAIFPMSANRRRMVATVDALDGDEPSLELVRQLLAERAPAGMEALALNWSTYFRIHHRQAARLRVGRSFIAGDAAHIHSPFGGQGMNTGLQDVWNLGWKIEWVVRGLANDGLLDTYTVERRPVIRRVIATTDLLTRVMGTSNGPAQVLRDVTLPILLRRRFVQRRMVRTLAELDIAYEGSPIVSGAGQRCLHPSMRGGKGIRSRFVLLVGDRCDPRAKQAAAQLAGAGAGRLLEWRVVPSAGVTLVRPDGYVAYTAEARKGIAAVESAASVLQRVAREDCALPPS